MIFLPEYRAAWCYEPASKNCKQFKLARIHEIELLSRDWENEAMHKIPFTDAFKISATKPLCRIEAILSLKAYNLLLEEYPLSKDFIKKGKKGYELQISVAGYQGIGRFVIGLPGEIEISGSEGFKEFLRRERKKFFD